MVCNVVVDVEFDMMGNGDVRCVVLWDVVVWCGMACDVRCDGVMWNILMRCDVVECGVHLTLSWYAYTHTNTHPLALTYKHKHTHIHTH